MYKWLYPLVIVVLLVLQCAEPGVSGNGGASETVASVVPWENGIKLTVESDTLFNVTAQVCSFSYSPVDTEYYHVTLYLDDQQPEQVLTDVPYESLVIIIRNPADSTAAYLMFDWTVSIGNPGDRKSFTATAAVNGFVTEQSGNDTLPVNGITVYMKGTFFAAVTDESGFYRIGGVPEGIYTIEADGNVRRYKTPDQKTVAVSGDTMVNFTVLSN